MKNYFFLFFIIIFSSNTFLDTEVEEFVNAQHTEIFNFLNNNQDLFDSDKEKVNGIGYRIGEIYMLLIIT